MTREDGKQVRRLGPPWPSFHVSVGATLPGSRDTFSMIRLNIHATAADQDVTDTLRLICEINHSYEFLRQRAWLTAH